MRSFVLILLIGCVSSLVLPAEKALTTPKSCTLENIKSSANDALTCLTGVTCIKYAIIPGHEHDQCFAKDSIGSGLGWGGALSDYILYGKSIKYSEMAQAEKTRAGKLAIDIASTQKEIETLNKLMVQAVNERGAIEITKSQKFFETGSDSQKLRTAIRKDHLIKLGEEISQLQDAKYLELKYNSNIRLLNIARNASKVSEVAGMAIATSTIRGSAICEILSSNVVTEVDENCNPVPMLGNSELKFLNLSEAEQREKIEKYPELCGHFDNIAKNYSDKLNIITSLYYSGNKVSDLTCSENGFTYKLKGNAYVGNPVITASYSSDKKIQKLKVDDQNSNSKRSFEVDYADDGKVQILNSIRWTSSDPADSWRGGRVVLRTQLEAASENPAVERASVYNTIHEANEKKIQACCANQNQCQGIGLKGANIPTKGRRISQ